ncbi:RidA family protein [Maledivibacter halophilus]|uniref:Endoribonuclease L-PSP n=1 Tax=Maledivibacter halophilus TaxID=36842 RepID=A0A1T5IBT7_9FIRM|nr:RidA family protein [Maledivibacter halophilus]SKC36619.1 endoribonuclease L-PSP [Maledivibacter halophilus]
MKNASRDVVSTSNAPEAVGAYSQAIKLGGFLFTSGQIPVNPKNSEMVQANFKDQTKQSMDNVLAILNSEGMTVDNIVKSTIFITDMTKFSEVNSIYESYFDSYFPARACVEVSALPKGALVEIEVIAHK